MPLGSVVAEVEAKLKKRYGRNNRAVFGTLNKLGLMRGNKATSKGIQDVSRPGRRKVKQSSALAKLAYFK